MFLNIFMPRGIPTAIIPFLIPIELISYLSRVISLSVRLFANTMSGHTLLKILAGFLWAFLSHKGPLSFFLFKTVVIILPWLVIMAVLVLECAVAFLQAYVFTVLIAIYLNESINLH
jgi:ATP synthase subunit 6